MRSIYIITVVILALLLSACSDGDGYFETSTTSKVAITVCEIYVPIQANDILVKEDDNTTIKIVHDANGSRKVCTLIGAAHLVREGN